MNRAALEHGFPVVATGHNLDDEAATLFGSVLHWQTNPRCRASRPRWPPRTRSSCAG